MIRQLFIIITFLLGFQLTAGNGGDKQLTRHVSGRITDTSGEAVVGARIEIKSGTGLVFTDLEGKFTIEVNKESTAVLQINSPGFAPLEVKTSELSLISELVLTGF